MKGNLNGSILVVLMFILQSWAFSLQAPDDVLTDAPETMEVIPAPSALNAPGFHEDLFSQRPRWQPVAITPAPFWTTCPFHAGATTVKGNLGNGLESSIQYVPDSVLWGVNQSIGLTSDEHLCWIRPYMCLGF